MCPSGHQVTAGGCNGDGSTASALFRDCSVCLESLADPTQKMTFIVPCGHVFHTRCFQQWNKARCYNNNSSNSGNDDNNNRQHLHQSSQCSTCNGSVDACFYVCSDHNCILCRQSIHTSGFPVSFTLPDKRLVHTECWSLFQQHGKAMLTSSSSSSGMVSLCGDKVKECHRVFLHNDKEDDDNENSSATLSRFLDSLQTKLTATTSCGVSDQMEALNQLLAMVVVVPPPNNDYSIDGLEATLVETSNSPTRQTAIAVVSKMIPTLVDLIKTTGTNEGRQVFEKGCYLLALLCSNHAENCQELVRAGGLTAMLFRDKNYKDDVDKDDNSTMPFGLSVALKAFAQQQQVSSVIVKAGAIEAIMIEMKNQPPDNEQALYVGSTFLLELSKQQSRAGRLFRRSSCVKKRLVAVGGDDVLIQQTKSAKTQRLSNVIRRLLSQLSLTSSAKKLHVRSDSQTSSLTSSLSSSRAKLNTRAYS